MTHFTVKWRPEKATKKLATARAALETAEEVWYLGVCNNLKPLASEIALTSVRLVVLLDREVKFSARYEEISSLKIDDDKGSVAVTRSDGGSMTIKMVPKDDLRAIQHYVDYGLTQIIRPSSSSAAASAVAAKPKGVSLVKHRTSGPVETRDSVVNPVPPGDLANQLERIAALHSAGILSDAEFTAAKARLLG